MSARTDPNDLTEEIVVTCGTQHLSFSTSLVSNSSNVTFHVNLVLGVEIQLVKKRVVKLCTQFT